MAGLSMSHVSILKHMAYLNYCVYSQVEDFDVDMEIDTAKLDVFGTIITQVKMEGRVPASTHLVYDCSHGEWLLAQIAYDRNIRLFSSRWATSSSVSTVHVSSVSHENLRPD